MAVYVLRSLRLWSTSKCLISSNESVKKKLTHKQDTNDCGMHRNSVNRFQNRNRGLNRFESIFSDFFYQNKALIKTEDIMPNHHQQSTYSSWKNSARTFCYWYFWLRFIEGTTIQCWKLAHICCSENTTLECRTSIGLRLNYNCKDKW